jgi:hypothetical protein
LKCLVPAAAGLTGQAPPTAEFKAIYRFVTTVQGNRFRFRGGDPDKTKTSLQELLGNRLGGQVRTHVEN